MAAMAALSIPARELFRDASPDGQNAGLRKRR